MPFRYSNLILISEESKWIMDNFRIFRNDCILKYCMVKYCYDFVSAIVFGKEQNWDKVVIDLVFPNTWNLSSTILK